MNLDDMKKMYCIGPDLIPADGPVTVEISRFDSEEVPARPAKNGLPAMPAGWRHLVYFRGWDLPLRLNNQKIDAIKAATGMTDTEDLVGQLIMLQTLPVTKFGTTELDVIILAARAKPGQKAITQNQAARNNQLGPGVDEKPKLPASRDIRPIGPDIAKKLVAQLKLKSTNYDAMLKWLRANDADAAAAMSGVELHEIPAWTLASAKYYMDSLNMPPELVQPPKHEETIEIAVPF